MYISWRADNKDEEYNTTTNGTEHSKKYLYDVFVLYNEHNDRLNTMIMNTIYPMLRDHGLRAFVPIIDSTPGKIKWEEYGNAILKSRKILCLLTNDITENNLLKYLLGFGHCNDKYQPFYGHVVFCQFERIGEMLSEWHVFRHMTENAIFYFGMEDYMAWSEERRELKRTRIAASIRKNPRRNQTKNTTIANSLLQIFSVSNTHPS